MRRKAQESFVGLQNLCRHYSHIVMGLRTPVLLFAAMLVLSDARADLLDEVPQQARDELAGGQIVVKSENVPGAPWPRPCETGIFGRGILTKSNGLCSILLSPSQVMDPSALSRTAEGRRLCATRILLYPSPIW
jgi:hypothetical protein